MKGEIEITKKGRNKQNWKVWREVKSQVKKANGCAQGKLTRL